MGPLGIPTPDKEVTDVRIPFLMETIAVLLIHIVRISLMIDKRGHKDSNGIAIGGAYTCMIGALAPLSGGCLNPARAIGPIFFMDKIISNQQFVLAAAPFLGTYLAMLIYKKFLMSDELEDELDEL